MSTPILDFVLSRLDASKGRWPLVAKESGVPYRSLEKLVQRKSRNPRIENIQKLHDYFLAKESA